MCVCVCVCVGSYDIQQVTNGLMRFGSNDSFLVRKDLRTKV